ncbi:Segregation and condensation protein B [compost metagenome]
MKSDRAIQSLVSKDLIEEVGRAEAIGRPILYGTTKAFLDYFGLSALSALPEPANVSAEDLDEGTNMLFEKYDGRQMTFDELPPMPAIPPIPTFPEEIAASDESEE